MTNKPKPAWPPGVFLSYFFLFLPQPLKTRNLHQFYIQRTFSTAPSVKMPFCSGVHSSTPDGPVVPPVRFEFETFGSTLIPDLVVRAHACTPRGKIRREPALVMHNVPVRVRGSFASQPYFSEYAHARAKMGGGIRNFRHRLLEISLYIYHYPRIS